MNEYRVQASSLRVLVPNENIQIHITDQMNAQGSKQLSGLAEAMRGTHVHSDPLGLVTGWRLKRGRTGCKGENESFVFFTSFLSDLWDSLTKLGPWSCGLFL